MLSIRTQAAIAVLHDISLGDQIRTTTFILSDEDWRSIFDDLEKWRIICLLQGKTAGMLLSYKLHRPLNEVSLLNILEATNEPIRCTMPTPEFYSRHSQIANKIGVFNQVARTLLKEIKIADW